MTDHAVISHERIFDGKVFAIDRDRVRMPNGREVTVDVVRHPRSVVLVPVPEPGHVVLIRQYRYAVNKFLWELPAGKPRDPAVIPSGSFRSRPPPSFKALRTRTILFNCRTKMGDSGFTTVCSCTSCRRKSWRAQPCLPIFSGKTKLRTFSVF